MTLYRGTGLSLDPQAGLTVLPSGSLSGLRFYFTRAFLLLGRFLCSQLHGTATDSDAKQCQKVPSKLVDEENASGGVRREKKERCEI